MKKKIKVNMLSYLLTVVLIDFSLECKIQTIYTLLL